MKTWTAVVPVRPLSLGDSDPFVVEATVLSTLDIARECDAIVDVLVVTADVKVAGAARKRGMTVMVDRPMLSPDPINDAIRMGVQWAASRGRGDGVVMLPVDILHLTADGLDRTLDELSARPRAFVPHLDGIGVTLVSTTVPRDFDPLHGPRAAHAYSRAGYTPIVGVPCEMRGGLPSIQGRSKGASPGVVRTRASAV